MYHNFFICSSVDGHLGCFLVLAVVNSAAVNTEVSLSFSITVFSGHMPCSGIAGSYGSFMKHFFSKEYPSSVNTFIILKGWLQADWPLFVSLAVYLMEGHQRTLLLINQIADLCVFLRFACILLLTRIQGSLACLA